MLRTRISDRLPHEQGAGDARWLVMTFGALLGVIAIASGLLWAMGLFDFSGTASAAKALAAVLTLLGTTFATTVTLVGLLLKRSFDARNLVLKTEAEERLKLDTAIKAVELFKSASGSASPAESAGALFALVRLGEFHFALRLLEQLWPKGTVESPSALWVINNSLHSTETGVPELAALVLSVNSGRLLNNQGGKWWPSDYEFESPAELSYMVQKDMLQARIKSLLSAKFNYWSRNDTNVDIVALVNYFRSELSPQIRQSAAAFLAILLQTYDPRENQKLVLPTGDHLSIEEVRAEIEETYGLSFVASNEQDIELQNKLGA